MTDTKIKLRRIYKTAKEYGLTILGRSYFHEYPREGKSWKIGRSYFNDSSSKLNWNRERINGLPALRELDHDELYIFPINALQYGLGAIDAGDRVAVCHVEDWLEGELKQKTGQIRCGLMAYSRRKWQAQTVQWRSDTLSLLLSRKTQPSLNLISAPYCAT